MKIEQTNSGQLARDVTQELFNKCDLSRLNDLLCDYDWLKESFRRGQPFTVYFMQEGPATFIQPYNDYNVDYILISYDGSWTVELTFHGRFNTDSDGSDP